MSHQMGHRQVENPRIEICLKESRGLDPFAATIEALGRESLPFVSIERVHTSALDVPDALMLNIIGSITARSLIGFVTRISAALARLRTRKVHLVITYQGTSFEMPHDAERLVTRLQKRPTSE
jgi:hypothetical protein